MLYKGEHLNEISFPLGGIGTGCIGLAGNGSLIDWEIFNRPNKGSTNGHSHFAIKAIDGEKVTTKILMGDVNKEFMGRLKNAKNVGYGHGLDRETMGGFPNFRNVEFNGTFPVADLHFTDDILPAKVTMTAFNPFIPLDDANSSLPAAFFEFTVENPEEREIQYQLAFSVRNPYAVNRNKAQKRDGITGITLQNTQCDDSAIEYGDLTMATDAADTLTQSYWYRGRWLDPIVTYWNEFSALKDMSERSYEEEAGLSVATLVAKLTVPGKESRKVRFLLSWNVPNCYNYWSEYKDEQGQHITWKNYYATVFANSRESAQYCLKNWDMLYSRTKKFRDSIHNMTMDPAVIDAVTANLSVLKSPTVLRLEDGAFYGWEGVSQNDGSCEGTCQHVWNYAYALCFLFPKLERSIRDAEFRYAMDEDGKTVFRLKLPYGRDRGDVRACVDGQMGTVFKMFREWKLSGDTAWLKSHWNDIKLLLAYAWSEKNPDRWDFDRDGVLEGRQHHTLDMELFGPSSWLQSMYLTALKAAAEMAEVVGDGEAAKLYREIFAKGFRWTDENLFNGKYFVHKVDVKDKSVLFPYEDAVKTYWNAEKQEIKYQIQDGSIIDQMLGQWHADILGLGDVFAPDKVQTALQSMMENNFKASMREFVNPWRLYCLNDEAGTIMCDYPAGTVKPIIPITYSEETMTGFEYAFAGLLMSRGFVEDGIRVVKAIRDRYDGKKRNPWNEIECGSNYARSMASFALLPILSGFRFDMVQGRIAFAPKVEEAHFRCFWSVASGYGEYTQCADGAQLTVFEGKVQLSGFGIPNAQAVKEVRIDGTACDFTVQGDWLLFPETVVARMIEIKR